MLVLKISFHITEFVNHKSFFSCTKQLKKTSCWPVGRSISWSIGRSIVRLCQQVGVSDTYPSPPYPPNYLSTYLSIYVTLVTLVTLVTVVTVVTKTFFTQNSNGVGQPRLHRVCQIQGGENILLYSFIEFLFGQW